MNSHLKQTIHQGSTGFSRTVFLQNPLVYCFQLINKVIKTIQLLSNVCYKKQQEVGDGLSVCVLNILPKVSSLLSLLAINVMKVEIQIFSNSHVTLCWSFDQRIIFRNRSHYVSTLPSVVSIHLLQVEICILFFT